MAFYPKARISMEGGDLVDVTDLSYEISDGSSQVHTIRQRGAGFTQGNEETKVSFNSVVSELGEEFDGIANVKNPVQKQIRIKVPGRTITVNGKFDSMKLDNASDSPIKAAYTFIGHTDE